MSQERMVKQAIFVMLPQETCEAAAGGVSLSAKECDDILSWLLVPGYFVILTDGAGAYQSLAPKYRIAHHAKDLPVSFNKARHNEHYAHLKLSHGIVSHDAEQWAVVDKVKVVEPDGKVKVVALKKGTQVVDGLWPELRGSIPDAVNSKDWDRCLSYMWCWIWRMRRPSTDLLVEFGKTVSKLRKSRRSAVFDQLSLDLRI